MTTKIKYHNKEEAIETVTKDGNELRYCTPELQHDENVVLAALKKDDWYFQHASDTLKIIRILF